MNENVFVKSALCLASDLSALISLKGLCGSTSCRIISDRRTARELLCIQKNIMSHCSTSVDGPTILQLEFIFKPSLDLFKSLLSWCWKELA